MKVGIIVGSTRDGRLGERVSKWVAANLEAADHFETELLDLGQFKLPLYHDTRHPAAMGGQYDDPAVGRWAEAVAGCDAFVFVTPEYNHSIPAALKNAIDWLFPEWADKAAAVVSYSGTWGGGIRAAEHLRQILAWLGVAVIAPAVHINNAGQVISEDGEYDDEHQQRSLQSLMDKLQQWAAALNSVRQPA